MLVLMGLVFYFLLIRPQQKRMKEHKELIGGLKRGDEVITQGGMIGRLGGMVGSLGGTIGRLGGALGRFLH